jgi:hypothetical protein
MIFTTPLSGPDVRGPIPVDDPVAVGEFEGRRDGDQDADLLRERQRDLAPDDPVEVFAGQQLLHDERDDSLDAEFVDGRDVGMMEVPRELRLPESAGAHAGVRELAGLQGDGPPDHRVPGLVDRSEASGRDLLHDFVLADLPARLLRRLRPGWRSDLFHRLPGSEPAHQPPFSTPGRSCPRGGGAGFMPSAVRAF